MKNIHLQHNNLITMLWKILRNVVAKGNIFHIYVGALFLFPLWVGKFLHFDGLEMKQI